MNDFENLIKEILKNNKEDINVIFQKKTIKELLTRIQKAIKKEDYDSIDLYTESFYNFKIEIFLQDIRLYALFNMLMKYQIASEELKDLKDIYNLEIN